MPPTSLTDGGSLCRATCVENGPRSLDVDQEFTTFVYASETSWKGTGPSAMFKGDYRLTNKDIDRPPGRGKRLGRPLVEDGAFTV